MVSCSLCHAYFFANPSLILCCLTINMLFCYQGGPLFVVVYLPSGSLFWVRSLRSTWESNTRRFHLDCWISKWVAGVCLWNGHGPRCPLSPKAIKQAYKQFDTWVYILFSIYNLMDQMFYDPICQGIIPRHIEFLQDFIRCFIVLIYKICDIGDTWPSKGMAIFQIENAVAF